LEPRTLLASGPRITAISPTELINATFDHVAVTWNEPIDQTTFTTDDVSLSGPAGSVTISGVTKLDDTDYQVSFAPLSQRGGYQIAIGPNIADLSGNLMDQNQNGTGGEASDVFRSNLTYVVADTVFTSPVTISESNTTYDGQDIAIKGTTVTIDGTHSFGSIQLIDGAVLTHSANGTTRAHTQNLTVAQQVIVDASSRIDASGKGLLSGGYYGPGSYGGWGGPSGASQYTNAIYGDYTNPDETGSGSHNDVVAYPGGGLIRLTAAALALDGQILADGVSGGSGGGIFVSVATLTGSGIIRAADGVDGGGGGRVAVYAADFGAFDTGSITAPGGASSGGAGTVYLRDTNQPHGTLIIDDATAGGGVTPLGLPGQGSFTIPDDVIIRGSRTRVQPEHSGMTIDVQGQLTITNSASLTRSDGSLMVQSGVTIDGSTLAGHVMSASSISVLNGGILTAVDPIGDVTTALILDVTGTLSVDATSRIDLTGKGRLSGGYFGGGSYGGLGAGGVPYANPIYGDYADPDEPGSGAGNDLGRYPGGGLVRATAGTLALDGQIIADGVNGGSGGGILVDADSLVGAGTISAAGVAGGGGGRVAVYTRDISRFNPALITAPGGTPGGGAGTVWVIIGHLYTHVRNYSPKGLNGDYVASLSGITVSFSEPIDTASYASIEIDGQMGTFHPLGLTLISDRTYGIELPAIPFESGPYHFTILPTFRDAEGNELDQNANGTPGEADDTFSWSYILDTIPPRVTHQDPAGDLAGTIDHADLWFSEAIDTSTIGTNDISIIKPNGTTVAATSIQNVGLNRYRISFPAQTLVGIYHLKVDPNITDLAGNGLEEDGDGIGGEPTDVYDGTFNLVPVNLGLNSLTVSATTLTAGEPVTVSWNGANQTGAPLLGDWIDGVYLSTDGTWDINDIRLALVPHTGGLAENQPYSGSATLVIPGVLPGNYQILVRADVANQERETNEADNLISSGPIPLVVHMLDTSGGPASGILTNADPSDYYAVHVNGGDGLALNLTGNATTGANELYASLGVIPTRIEHDFGAVKDERFFDRQNEALAFTAPPGGGTYYMLVYGAQINGSSPYNLSATAGDFVVTSITPDHGTNRPPDPAYGTYRPVGRVIPTTVTIAGAGFSDTTTVEFIAPDHTVERPTATHFVSSTALTLDLDPTTWAAGSYDVQITKGTRTDVRPGAFTIVNGGVPNLVTDIVAPSVVAYRVPVPATIWIEYKNTGTAPMPAPLLKLTADQQARITADRSLAFPTPTFENLSPDVTGTVQVMATGSGATPGILQPGDSGRIPVYYLGRGIHGNLTITFTLSDLTADDVSWSHTTTSSAVIEDPPGSGHKVIETTTYTVGEDWHVDWTKAATGPESIAPDAWNAAASNLNTMVGTQWGDYVVALADDANALHALGQDTQDVGTLYGFEAAQASASLNPISYLAGSVDASIPTPGLPLSFSRVYGQSILSRYKLGSLGRGWSTNWDVRAEVESNGDAVLRGPGGVDRFFTKQADGGFEPSTGDFATLTSTANGFKLTETDQTVWQFRTDGKLDFVADPNGNRITLGYDANGRLITLTHSNGQQLLIDYNADGRIAHVTNPLGPGTADDLVTTYEYDASGEHLLRVIAPGNRVTDYAYDSGTNDARAHALLEVAYPDGTHDHFEYDDLGRLVSTSADGGAQQLNFSYDSAGGVTVTDATGRTTFLAYGLNGHLEQVRDGDGRIVDFVNCDCGHLQAPIGPSGERYDYSYDTRGNLTGIRDPLRQNVTFTYDSTFNQITSVTDARGNGMTYGYDAQGNLVSITYADGTHENYTYDANGDVLTATNRRGQTVTYTYNAAGQVTSKDYPGTPGIDYVYAYDAAGNLVSATDPSGTTTMSYDPATNLLTRINYPGGLFFTFEYDAAGHRTKRTDQDGHVEAYTYDAAGRLDTMTDENGALIVHYEYDAAGRLSKKTLGNGVYTTYDYDAAGDILHLVNYEPDGGVLSRFDYAYDASGRRSSMTTLDGTQTYGYDPLGQLTSVAYSDGRVVSYAYDGAGNRTQVDDNGVVTPYSTNSLNQYTSVGNAVYTYDADGNMKTKTENGVTTTYTYDAENRLIGVSTPTDNWTYSYDAFGNRIASTHNGVTTKFIIDPTGLGNLAAEYDAMGNVIARYDHGYGLLDRTDGSGNADYYTFSAIGNTSELTNSNGAPLNTYWFDPFGQSLGKTETVANPFQFVGEYGVMDDGSGLQFMRRRYCSTQVGRFTQEDPKGLAGDTNLARYAHNNPVSLLDPTGEDDYEVDPSDTTPHAPITIQPWLPTRDPTPRIPGNKVLKHNLEIFLHKSDCFAGGLDAPFEPSGSAGQAIGDAIGGLPAMFNACADMTPFEDPNQPDDNRESSSSTTVTSFDPNDKLGPAGFGDGAYIPATNTLAYQVQFENDSTATAPAQHIAITDTLDPNLDLNSLELTEIDFANQTFPIPEGLDHFETTASMTANGKAILVNVQAELNRTTRELTLTLDAVDPNTGWYPDDPLVGFLYPEDGTGRGVGSISYRVSPIQGLPSGTVIQNRATIVFDYNDPINTPPVHNTLDAAAPTSAVAALPSSTTDTTLNLNWSGQDEPGGSGIASYTVYVSVDGGTPLALFADTTDTSGTVTVETGHTYAFYSVATDNVGHVEAAPAVPDATIQVVGAATTTTVESSNTAPTYGDSLSFTATVTATAPDFGTPGGTVQFLVDGSMFGTPVTLVNGAATSDPISTLAAGQHTISAIYSPAGIFAASTGVLSTTVARATLTITADDQARPYGEPDPALTYQITAGALIGSDTLSGGLARVPGEDVGLYPIQQGTLTAGANYDLTFVGGSLTISPRPITVTAEGKTKTYGDADPALTYQITSGSLVGSDVFSGGLARDAGEDVGTYAINQGSLALSANYALSYASASLIITARPITVTADPRSKTYGDADPALTYQITSGSLVGSDAFIGSLTRDPGENVGSYAIDQGTLALSTDYALSFTGANLIIAARPITVTADPKSKVQGTADPTLTYQITVGSLVGGDAFTGSLTRDPGENVGSYLIRQGTLTAGTNYDLVFVTASFTITASGLVGTTTTVAVSVPSPVYGQSWAMTAIIAPASGTDTPTGTVQFLIDGANFGVPVTLVSGAATSQPVVRLGAGNHTVSAAYSGDNRFASSTSDDLDQTVAKAHLTVTADNKDMNHGDAIPALTWAISGFVTGDTAGVVQGAPNLATLATSSSSAGRYPITVGQGSLKADNYDFPNLVAGNLTVHPKVVDVRAVYGSKSISLIGLNRDLPYVNINAIDVIFSDNVAVNLGQLALAGTNIASYGFSGFGYNTQSNDATWKLPSALGIDRLMLALNGETFANDPTIGVNPLALKFAVLPGDVNGDGVVNVKDVKLVRNAMRRTADPSLIGWADVDGNGRVDINDFKAVRKRVGTRL
jgi:RHS repeat-associated protein